jgi:hypothetical protein
MQFAAVFALIQAILSLAPDVIKVVNAVLDPEKPDEVLPPEAKEVLKKALDLRKEE